MTYHRPSDLERSRSVRFLQAALGLLNLTLFGMLVYLRAGPFARLVRSFEERGVEIPAWVPLLLNTAVIVVGGYVAWRALGHFRAALRPSGASDGVSGPL